MELTLWFRVDSKQLCKASLKTYLSHVLGSCSYLNDHLETLNSSLPCSSIKTKTATKRLGKAFLMWGVGCPMPAPPDFNSEQGSSTDTHAPTRMGNPSTWRTAKTTWNSIQTMALVVQRKRTQWGTKQFRMKGSPATLQRQSLPSLGPPLGYHITPVPGTNSHLTTLT